MTESPIKIDPKHLQEVKWRGLNGRALELRSDKKKNFVLISGQHTALERAYAVAQALNDYGNVYSPDLPGFGGMKGFYDIGLEPSYDLFADYLYDYVVDRKLEFDLNFFGVSFGAQVVTRMLQRHPGLIENVESSIGFVGVGGPVDFKIPLHYKLFLRGLSNFGKTRLGSRLLRMTALNDTMIGFNMKLFSMFKAKMHGDNNEAKQQMIDMERYLWEVGDLRTHGKSTLMMFDDPICEPGSEPQINIEFNNIITENDQFVSNERVAASYNNLYTKYTAHLMGSTVHMPSMLADKHVVAGLIPDSVKEILTTAE